MIRSDRAYDAPRTGSSRRGPGRAAAALTAAVACAALATGCGIRSTLVPVDAGAAPSRMPCRTSAAAATAQPLESIPVHVYLVCASQLATVERTVEVDESSSDRVRMAQSLLGELQRVPTAEEQRAGFSTEVPTDLRVTAARKGDPEGTLRLSEQPEDLPAQALAQVVCSYAESESLSSRGSVLLGGPGNYTPRGYLCTTETKSRPGNVPTLGAVELP
ncbi:hypothetical protein [Streptomyces sp. NBC_00887]|uniref:hypothetical protein n=1 Tax=Streptomyces sp. NBC_00887 TaxID=2975859 RepID=UPI0038633DFB|nr:hypothetical protein OG844_22510 [Streptomyces sp. NBC_00887]